MPDETDEQQEQEVFNTDSLGGTIRSILRTAFKSFGSISIGSFPHPNNLGK
jgi:hypothetical protein